MYHLVRNEAVVAKGRPREFDVDRALDRALKVFWRKGFEGASLPDLTKAMGINRPSLYAAFGNKAALFRRAVERYIEGPASQIRRALEEPTARQVVERWFRENIELITDSRNPRGCFLVQSALTCGDTADTIRRELARRRAASETALCERFERAIAEGDLPRNCEPADLARYVATVSQGMAVQAAGGATREELQKVAERALSAWPK